MRSVLLLALLTVGCSPQTKTSVRVMQLENDRRGAADWWVPYPQWSMNHEVEAYTDRFSYLPGDRMAVMVSTSTSGDEVAWQPVGPRVRAEIAVERPILLHDDDHMFDLVDAVVFRRARLRVNHTGHAPGEGKYCHEQATSQSSYFCHECRFLPPHRSMSDHALQSRKHI